MTTGLESKLKKIKKRRILIISAGGIQSGIQALYIGTEEDDNWSIYSKAFIPYPQKMGSLIEQLNETQDPVQLSELGWLEYKTSMLFLESAKAALAQSPKAVNQPHLIVLNKLTLWKGITGESLQQSNWNLTIGDAQYVASSLNLPVLTDFIRQNILAGGPGVLPVSAGNIKIAKKTSGPAVFVNTGLISRMSIIDTKNSAMLLESDIGPGTILIDKCVKGENFPEGFDRDGHLSQKGVVNTECLEKLASDPWFSKPAPKQSSIDSFMHLLNQNCLKKLKALDKIATITALSAKTIFDFYLREYTLETPEAIWLSGGGSNNLTLIDYLNAYFEPVPIRNIEELGIPSDVKIPLTLGLTVDSFLSGAAIPWDSGSNPRVKPLARWVLP